MVSGSMGNMQSTRGAVDFTEDNSPLMRRWLLIWLYGIQVSPGPRCLTSSYMRQHECVRPSLSVSQSKPWKVRACGEQVLIEPSGGSSPIQPIAMVNSKFIPRHLAQGAGNSREANVRQTQTTSSSKRYNDMPGGWNVS